MAATVRCNGHREDHRQRLNEPLKIWGSFLTIACYFLDEPLSRPGRKAQDHHFVFRSATAPGNFAMLTATAAPRRV